MRIIQIPADHTPDSLLQTISAQQPQSNDILVIRNATAQDFTRMGAHYNSTPSFYNIYLIDSDFESLCVDIIDAFNNLPPVQKPTVVTIEENDLVQLIATATRSNAQVSNVTSSTSSTSSTQTIRTNQSANSQAISAGPMPTPPHVTNASTSSPVTTTTTQTYSNARTASAPRSRQTTTVATNSSSSSNPSPIQFTWETPVLISNIGTRARPIDLASTAIHATLPPIPVFRPITPAPSKIPAPAATVTTRTATAATSTSTSTSTSASASASSNFISNVSTQASNTQLALNYISSVDLVEASNLKHLPIYIDEGKKWISCSIDPKRGFFNVLPSEVFSSFDSLFPTLNIQGQLVEDYSSPFPIPYVSFQISDLEEIERFNEYLFLHLKSSNLDLENQQVKKGIPLTYLQKQLLISLGNTLTLHANLNIHDCTTAICPWINEKNQICAIVPGFNLELVGLEQIYNYATTNKLGIHNNFWILLHRHSQLELTIRKDVFSTIDADYDAGRLSADEVTDYEEFKCPLSLGLMREPVTLTVTSGEAHTYEKADLQNLIETAKKEKKPAKDPQTRAPFVLSATNQAYPINHTVKVYRDKFIKKYADNRGLKLENNYLVTYPPINSLKGTLPSFLTQPPFQNEKTTSLTASGFTHFSSAPNQLKRSMEKTEDTEESMSKRPMFWEEENEYELGNFSSEMTPEEAFDALMKGPFS